jgi:hypothetical protein
MTQMKSLFTPKSPYLAQLTLSAVNVDSTYVTLHHQTLHTLLCFGSLACACLPPKLSEGEVWPPPAHLVRRGQTLVKAMG